MKQAISRRREDGSRDIFIRAAILDSRIGVDRIEFALHDPELERGSDPVWVGLPTALARRREGEPDIRDLPSRLLGGDVDLVLHQNPNRSGLDIVAIGTAWLHRRRWEAFVEARNTLASMKGTEG